MIIAYTQYAFYWSDTVRSYWRRCVPHRITHYIYKLHYYIQTPYAAIQILNPTYLTCFLICVCRMTTAVCQASVRTTWWAFWICVAALRRWRP